jgi:hypothetical protein
MAYYNYKHVRDLIPDDFRDKFIEEYNKNGYEYEGTCNYDGDMWLLAAAYIEELLEKIKILEDATPH